MTGRLVSSLVGEAEKASVTKEELGGVLVSQLHDPTAMEAFPRRLSSTSALDYASTANDAKPSQWTSRKKSAILFMALAKGLGFAGLTVIAPLFPPLARERGMSTTMNGLVFSALNFAAFLTAPIFGFLVPRLGVRTVIIGGLLLAGASNIGFGLMEVIMDPVWFTVGCFSFRITLGLAFAAYMTGIFSAVTAMFGEETGRALSIVEASIAIGIGAGPPIGSALFRVGGYKLPILTLGASMFVAAVPLAFLLPSVGSQEDDVADAHSGSSHEPTSKKSSSEEALVGKRKSLWSFFASWETDLALISIMVVAIAIVYFQPILQPFLQAEFGTTESVAGFVFLANLGSYCVATPIAGFISDARPDFTYFHIIFGLTLAALGCLIVGPANFLLGLMPRSLWTTIAGLILIGIGFPFVIIPGYKMFSDSVANSGFNMDMKTRGIVSACWQSAFFLGDAIGPALASGIADYFSMISSFVTLAVVLFAMAIVLATHAVIKSSKRRST